MRSTCSLSIRLADRPQPGKKCFHGLMRFAAECGMNVGVAKKPGGDPPGFSKRWMANPVLR
jgi:hypothetical protein